MNFGNEIRYWTGQASNWLQNVTGLGKPAPKSKNQATAKPTPPRDANQARPAGQGSTLSLANRQAAIARHQQVREKALARQQQDTHPSGHNTLQVILIGFFQGAKQRVNQLADQVYKATAPLPGRNTPADRLPGELAQGFGGFAKSLAGGLADSFTSLMTPHKTLNNLENLASVVDPSTRLAREMRFAGQNGGSIADAKTYATDPDQAIKDARKLLEGTGNGLTEPHRKAWNEDRRVEAVTMAATDIGSMVLPLGTTAKSSIAVSEMVLPAVDDATAKASRLLKAGSAVKKAVENVLNAGDLGAKASSGQPAPAVDPQEQPRTRGR